MHVHPMGLGIVGVVDSVGLDMQGTPAVVLIPVAKGGRNSTDIIRPI